MSRFVMFANSKKSSTSNPRVFAGEANSRGWGRAGPTARDPARDMFESQGEG